MAVRQVRLEVYAFGADSTFEGWLVNALERLEIGGSVQVLDLLFVSTDRSTGDVTAFDARGEGLSTMLVALLDFRLDARARERATAAVLEGADDTVRRLVDTMERGAAFVALLLEHAGPAAPTDPVLDDAVLRAHGTPVISRPVDARRLADVATDLEVAAALRGS